MLPDEDDLDLDLDNLPGDPEPDPAPQDALEDVPEDEPEPEDEPADPQDEPADPSLQRTVPRSESRIRTLVDENRRKDTELSDVRRRLDELTGRVNAPQLQQESPEQRATRLALLSPEERIREELRESTTQHRRDLQMMQFQLAENSDKASFEAKATVDPLYKKWSPKVEQELANLRRQNQNVSREQLFYYLVGKAAIEARDGAGSRQQRRAAESRVRRATTKPTNTRSDSAPAARTRQTQSLEKRLENVNI
jgi:hypothetical protein